MQINTSQNNFLAFNHRKKNNALYTFIQLRQPFRQLYHRNCLFRSSAFNTLRVYTAAVAESVLYSFIQPDTRERFVNSVVLALATSNSYIAAAASVHLRIIYESCIIYTIT